MAKVVIRKEENAQQTTVPVGVLTKRDAREDFLDACERTELFASVKYPGRVFSPNQTATVDPDTITSGVSENGKPWVRGLVEAVINGNPLRGFVGFFDKDAKALLDLKSGIENGQSYPINCEGEVDVVMEITFQAAFTAEGGRFLNLKNAKPAQKFEDGHYGNVNEAQAVFPQW